MASRTVETVAIRLPAELVAKLEELKQDREEDRNKSIDDLVKQFCESYVHLRESQRWEIAHQEELEKAYADDPDPWDDGEIWEKIYPPAQDGKP
jgi:predicted transcriptional regulator